MVKFIMGKNFKIAWYNRRQFLFLSILLLICYTFILLGFNAQQGLNTRQDNLESTEELLGDPLNIRPNSVWTGQEVIGFEQEVNPENALYVGSLSIFDEQDHYQEIPIVLLSDQMMERLFNKELADDVIYGTAENNYEKLGALLTDFDFQKIEHAPEVLALNYGKDMDMLLEDTLFASINAIEKIDEELDFWPFFYPKTDADYQLFQETIESTTFVNQGENKAKAAGYGHNLAEFNSGVGDLGGMTRLLTWGSQMALVLLTVGMIGSFLIWMEQKKNIAAVEYLLGRKKREILFDQFLQLLFPELIAMSLALVLNIPLNSSFSLYYYDIIFVPETAGLVLLLLVIPLCIPMLYFAKALSNKSPMEFMKYVE